MATAEELLVAQTSGEQSAVDNTLVISNDLRTINIPKTVTNIGVEHDDEVLKLDFKMPRYLSTTDLSDFSIYINIINAQGETDLYEVKYPVIDESHIMFSWLVGPTATRYMGDTKFIICMKTFIDGVDDGGNPIKIIDREFNTTVATLPVLEGLEVDESIVTQYSDIIEQWKQDLFGEGESVVNTIQAASQQEQDAIRAMADYVRDEIPAEYIETASAAKEALRTKADAIVCTTQGETIAVHDSSDYYIRGMKVFGKTTQLTTTGKQLINIVQTTKTNNGITFSPNEDGSVYVKGTATAEAYYIFDTGNDIPVKNVELIASLSGSDKVYMVVGYFTADGTTVNSLATVDSKTADTFSYPADAATTRTFLGVNAGVTVDATVYPMVRLASILDDTYEPYSGGVASPSPSWPQQLHNVEEPRIYVCGKNVLGANSTRTATLVNGVTFETVEGSSDYVFNGTATNQNGSGLLVQTAYIQPGTYTCSVRGLSAGGNSADYINMKRINDPKTYIFTGLGNKTTRTFTITEETEILVEVVVCAGSSYNNSVVTVQLEAGDTATEYEPCKTTQTIALSRTLPGIPVTSGGNYTDANGQQWICDEIDFERGMYVKRIGSVVYDGSDDEGWVGEKPDDTIYQKTYMFFIKAPSDMNTDADYFCSNFGKDRGYGEDSEPTLEYMECVEFPTMSYLYFHMFKTGLTSLGLDGVRNYLAESPMTVTYVLNTPVETSLSSEEIATFETLHSNYTNTTVLNNTEAQMELRYNADTKIYVDNVKGDGGYVDSKIAEVKAYADSKITEAKAYAEDLINAIPFAEEVEF